jgi:hypothetical protein
VNPSGPAEATPLERTLRRQLVRYACSWDDADLLAALAGMSVLTDGRQE